MTKKSIFIVFLLFLMSFVVLQQGVNAQEVKKNDLDSIMDNIKGVAAFNAVLLGYAVYCDVPKEQVQSVESQFVTLINGMNLNNDDYNNVETYFMDNFKKAKERGPSNSNMSCSKFLVEFDKVYSAVKSGEITPKQ
jgi:hypothetical protein